MHLSVGPRLAAWVPLVALDFDLMFANAFGNIISCLLQSTEVHMACIVACAFATSLGL